MQRSGVHRLDESRVAYTSQFGAPEDAKRDVPPEHRCGTSEREREGDLTDHDPAREQLIEGRSGRVIRAAFDEWSMTMSNVRIEPSSSRLIVRMV